MNPAGLPNTLPFQCDYEANRDLLGQVASNEVQATLESVYDLGSAFGTPLSGSDLGNEYAADFIAFIERHCSAPGNCLEIGAGTGYLAGQLAARGWATIGLEPGKGYREAWVRNQANIIMDRFPSPKAGGPFDLVTSYGVLEHLNDPVQSLRLMKEHLAPGGKLVISVPDCTIEVAEGDPSILIHEHLTYFTENSLHSALRQAGFHAQVVRSAFARCLYAVGTPCDGEAENAWVFSDPLLATYPERAAQVIMSRRAKISAAAASGTLGVYAAPRGLAVLDPATNYRFFDDDPAWRGYFIPPFKAPIEGRDTLLAEPVDTLIILSRTFGKRIHNSLRNDGYLGPVVLLEELS